MTLDEIKSGKKVFIDANIFIYHFTGVSDECSGFLNWCEQVDLYGLTSVIVLISSIHRLLFFVIFISVILLFFFCSVFSVL